MNDATDEQRQAADESERDLSEPDESRQDPAPRRFTFKRTFTFGAPPARRGMSVVPGEERRWEWSLGNDHRSAERTDEVQEPATYYEAFTGRRDPQRDLFIRVRRVLNAIAWAVALGLPAGALILTVATGQDLQTIVLMTFAAFAVGMLLRRSFPRTPFD